MPLHEPDQPVKVEPESESAESVTVLKVVNWLEQAVPHDMPAGVLVIVPVPEPALVMVRDMVLGVM